MSLGVVIKGPEGVVLAADSRVTLAIQQPSGSPFSVNYDNATKLLSFGKPHTNVGAVTYGAAVIGQRTAHSFVPEFETTLDQGAPLSVEEFSSRLGRFYKERWQEATPSEYSGPSMAFIVGGYDKGAPYGKVFLLVIPEHPEPQPQNPGENEFGMTWGGQREIATRLIHGFDPALANILKESLELDQEKIDQATQTLRTRLEFRIPYNVLPLQDCVDLATFLIRSTITMQRMAVGVRGVGGPIDVATVTRIAGLEYVQRKQIRGEDHG